MNTENNNKSTEAKHVLGEVLIAKYMGITPIKGLNEYTGNEYYYYNNAEMQDFEALPNYKEWNELMPVVEKINKRDWVTIYNDQCKIHSLIVGEFEDINIINEGQPMIKSVYEAVLEYVELTVSLNLA
ncbi:hypothetical protein [Flavobacterium caseinilyticum]|uniref:Uncharacterized protein n=1 Tax=Flavobacterium caseinilyticum TaxID=2541732 RepID=A0A4R5AWS5_9FLAO|nr:hypothetical protein [Flavobacterium caseinilyticum]TDD75634.1 hypothetical protein E0F89_12155 [Flavobacterium caseinilyticum]